MRHGAATALLAALALVGAGCTSPDTVEDRVLVFGDSLVAGTTDAITTALQGAGWNPVVDGRGGWTTKRWANVLEPVVEEAQPRVAVVVLGTNDCAPECGDLSGAVASVMRTLEDAGVEHVYWLNVQTQPRLPKYAEKVNATLQTAAANWTSLSIVDLSSALGGRPELHDDLGIHFEGRGKIEFAALIRDAIAERAPEPAE